MIQAKLYQIPCLETGKFALHAEQITAGLDERQLGNSSCGLELGLSLVELARGGQGTDRDRKAPSKPVFPYILIVQSQTGLQGCASGMPNSDAQRVVCGWAKGTGSKVKWTWV